jgi:type I restriction enzyme S subunit
LTWKTSSLGEICELINRGISPSYVNEGGILVLNQKCIRNHQINYALGRRHNFALKPVKEERLIRAGDVLVNSTGTGTLGRVALVREEPSEPTTVDSHVTIVRAMKNQFNYLFFGWLLISIEEKIKEAGEGSVGQTELSRTTLRDKFIVSYPTNLIVQKRLAEKLDSIFLEIERATIATEANIKNAEALYKSHLLEIFSKPNKNSKIFNLGDLCATFHQGLNTAGEKVKFHDSGFPIIQTRNIDNGCIDITEKIKYLSKADWEKYKGKFKPEIGDIFFTNIGTIGKTAIVTTEDEYLIHWNIFKLRPKLDLITSNFMKLALDYLTLSGYFSEKQKGGTVAFVTKKMISEVSLPIPPLANQILLTNKIDASYSLCEKLRETYLNKFLELQKLKSSTLKQAFNGELVKD